MDIDALKTFLEVNRTRHFGLAAKNLYVSQSTVSARIKLLEEQIGLALFIRQRNNIQLTDAGQRLVRYAENIVTNWVRARQEIGIADEAHIPMVVGASTSLWDSILQDWIGHMYKAMPELSMHAEVQQPEVLFRRVLERSMDIAFVFDNPKSDDLECVQLTHMPLVMVSSTPGLTVDDALHHKYIMVDWGTSFINNHARLYPDAPIPHMRVMLARLGLDILIKQGGTAYITEPMVSRFIESGELHPVKNAPVIDRIVYALYHLEHAQSDLIKQTCHYFLGEQTPRLQAVE
ncbi:MAG: LysR family transcriptional regulator [Gammaproteobacteria bacterium]|nr:LysR family transcriptional regulator [Gammaproteobacteria bacterium]MDH5653727.1 LysR family transcriptional regulator [Gammaproteobacteria bacterium]